MPMKMGSNINLDKVVKNLGSRYKLVPHLDMAIVPEFEWEFKYEPKVGDDAWHPSGDCTPSLYSLWLKATGKLESQPVGPGLQKIFMVGHFYHQYFQWVVQRKLEFASPEDIERRGWKGWGKHTREALNGFPMHYQPYHWVTGSADIAPCKIPSHGEYLVDFKTVNPRMYATGMSPDYLAKWECQGNIYLDFFDMERALFVMIDKSNGDMKEILFRRNQPLIDSIYGKWELVSECLDEGIEPPEDEPWPLPLQGPSDD